VQDPPSKLRRGQPLSKRAAGAWGEDLALRYLTERGYEIVERNYRTRFGKLDLILRRGSTLGCILLYKGIAEHTTYFELSVLVGRDPESEHLVDQVAFLRRETVQLF
jgi:hypothetical protein